MNPTNDVFEQRIATLEGGVAALAVASGQATISLALLAITQVGDEIVSANNLYGGTYELFHYTFPKLGRKVIFVDSTKPEEFEKAINSKTRAIYAETIGNPKLYVPDFERFAKIAHDAGIPFVVDNTVGIGIVKPIDYGVDIIADLDQALAKVTARNGNQPELSRPNAFGFPTKSNWSKEAGKRMLPLPMRYMAL